jgi:hypothetical protein
VLRVFRASCWPTARSRSASAWRRSISPITGAWTGLR